MEFFALFKKVHAARQIFSSFQVMLNKGLKKFKNETQHNHYTIRIINSLITHTQPIHATIKTIAFLIIEGTKKRKKFIF